MNNSRNVVIIGAGAVGSTCAYALAIEGIADQIILIDKDRHLAEGQAIDLSHGAPFMPPVQIRTGTPADYADADMIIITAGVTQSKGQSRLDLLTQNAAIIREIMTEIVWHDSQACVLLVSNPVDILTRVALAHSGWPRERVFGSGTVLDTARLRYLTAVHCGIDPHNLHAYVVGEHGDSEFIPWSMAHVAGVPFEEYCGSCAKCEDWLRTKAELARQVRESAYHIIDYKGATWFGIGVAVVRIATAVLRDEHSVLTVSTMLEGEFNISNVCLGVPAVIGRRGVERIIQGSLTAMESSQLMRSAAQMQQHWETLQPNSSVGIRDQETPIT